MRKTIYVPNQREWDEVLSGAKDAALSVSQYLLGGEHMPRKSQLDRIEGKIEKLLNPHITDKGGEPPEWSKRVSGGQAKLDASRKGRDIKKEKIAKIKARPVMSSNFNPQPKKAK